MKLIDREYKITEYTIKLDGEELMDLYNALHDIRTKYTNDIINREYKQVWLDRLEERSTRMRILEETIQTYFYKDTKIEGQS